MQQFSMTPERLDVSREDIINMLKNKPKNKDKKDYVRHELAKFQLTDEEIDKVIADLDSY